MSSTLTLNNNLPEAATATVTVFNEKGQPFVVPPIELKPQTVVRFKMKELIKDARGDFKSGSLQVFYHGPSMAVTCQVTISSERQRLSFESIEKATMGFSSSRLDSIVWLPDDGTKASVALTNTSSDNLNVTITSSQEGVIDGKTIALGPRQMRLVDLNSFVKSRKGASGVALISLEHDAAPGALVVTGFALNSKKGFSCKLPFVDRSTAKTTRLAGAHVRFGHADGREGFTAETRFFAPLVIANASDTPTQATVFVDYTVGTIPSRVEVAQVSLAPREVKQIELSKEMARLGVMGPVDNAGVDIEYTGGPGAVIARLTSIDASGDYSFDVPIKDPLAEKLRVSGSYPWRLDDGHTTVLHLKNTIAKPVHALVQVRYEGGTYNLERIKMDAYQTVAVDIRQLRDSQAADIRGSVMPVDVEGGQVVWYEEVIGSLIGRAEVMNVAGGVASSFSCGGACDCGAHFHSAAVVPASMVGPIGEGSQFRSEEMRKDCLNNMYGPYDRTNDSTWTSTNASVASVTGSGFVSCLAVGSATINAQFSAVVFLHNCSTMMINPNPGGGVQVDPTVRVTAATFNPNKIATFNGTTDLTVQVSASPGVPPNSMVTIEVFQETNPNSVGLDVTPMSGQKTATLIPGMAIPIMFEIDSKSNNMNQGVVTYRARVFDVDSGNPNVTIRTMSPDGIVTGNLCVGPTTHMQCPN